MSEKNELDQLARHYHGMLRDLQESYQKAAQPILDKLMQIENVRPRTYVVDGKTFLPIDPTPLATPSTQRA